jgi:hypothetical protein
MSVPQQHLSAVVPLQAIPLPTVVLLDQDLFSVCVSCDNKLIVTA